MMTQQLRKTIVTLAATMGLTFPFVQSCSTLDPATGRCKKSSEAKYVAAMNDTDGKPWEIKISGDNANLSCDYDEASGQPRPEGYVVFSVAILDGQGEAKAGVAVIPRFSGTVVNASSTTAVPGFYTNPFKYKVDANGNITDTGDEKTIKDQNQSKLDDVATDSCGVAVFHVKWVCPAAKKTIAGKFFVESGPLFSKSVDVSVENKVQMQPIGTTTGTSSSN